MTKVSQYCDANPHLVAGYGRMGSDTASDKSFANPSLLIGQDYLLVLQSRGSVQSLDGRS